MVCLGFLAPQDCGYKRVNSKFCLTFLLSIEHPGFVGQRILARYILALLSEDINSKNIILLLSCLDPGDYFLNRQVDRTDHGG